MFSSFKKLMLVLSFKNLLYYLIVSSDAFDMDKKLLKLAAFEIAPFKTCIVNMSINTDNVPND